MSLVIEYYRRKGYTEDWISQRLFSIRVRKNLTFEWRERGVKTNSEYAILARSMASSGSNISSMRSLPTCASHSLNGSALGEGMDRTRRSTCSVVPASVR